jgi:YgiT-type zinc finger domain-containing protein
MICHICGAELQPIVTDLPFKTSDTSIVILKALPVLQCPNCREFLLDDPIMEKVDQVLQSVNESAELEIRRFAA